MAFFLNIALHLHKKQKVMAMSCPHLSHPFPRTQSLSHHGTGRLTTVVTSLHPSCAPSLCLFFKFFLSSNPSNPGCNNHNNHSNQTDLCITELRRKHSSLSNMTESHFLSFPSLYKSGWWKEKPTDWRLATETSQFLCSNIYKAKGRSIILIFPCGEVLSTRAVT